MRVWHREPRNPNVSVRENNIVSVIRGNINFAMCIVCTNSCKVHVNR